MNKTTTTTREYDADGRLIREVTVETDNRHTCTSYCGCSRYPYYYGNHLSGTYTATTN